VVAQLGPYLIDELLAEGGMARVFRARLRGLGGFEKTLVLKQVRPELAKDPRFVEMFVREANTLVQMSHPHIVPVYELGAVDGSYYLSMEYIEGATVTQLLTQGPLGPALVAQIGVQLCDALDYAHGRFGILHRDITPRNLIVDDAGHVRLLDFGIAAALDAGGAERFGSPGYMSPEQVQGKPLRPTSDLFSMGVVLYEALTGEPAFERVAKGSLAAAPRLSGRAEIPATIAALVDALLAGDPSQRPQSAHDVARTLREWLAQAQPEGAFAELRERARRVRTSAMAVSAAKVSSEEIAPEPPPGTARLERPAVELGTTAIAKPAALARAFATSPVLTEMLRSASGAPPPKPPSALSEVPLDQEPRTRRIEPEEVREGPRAPTTHGGATRFMLRAWPFLAFVSMAVALLVVITSPNRKVDSPVSVPALRPQSEPVRKVPVPGPNVPAPVVSTRSEQDAGATPAPVSETAYLTINATPWAEVTLDGRKVGTTPLRKLKTRAGSHTLRFDCPPLGASSRVQIMVLRGADARVVVDLSKAPPRTILDEATELR